MWQLEESPVSIALLESFYNKGKPIAPICHSLGGFCHVTYQGAPPSVCFRRHRHLPSSVSDTSAEVIQVCIGRWNQGFRNSATKLKAKDERSTKE
jgi:hypothetical protein